MMKRFCRYIDKIFDFGQQLPTLQDARKRPRIPTAALWGSVFFLFVLRQRSLNAMEHQLRQPKRIERLIGKIKPSADRMGDVLGLMEPDQLREMLSRVNHQLGRNKTLRNDWPLRVGAMDGHEFFSQPISMLPPVFGTDGDGQGSRGDRVFSSRRRFSFSGIPNSDAPGRGDDSTRRGGGDCWQTALGTSDASLWTIL
jgi:hypothetical protein